MAGKEELFNLLMGFIQDKRACLNQIGENMEQVVVVNRGLEKLQTQLQNSQSTHGGDDSPVNVVRALIVLTKSMRQLATSAQINGMLALLHVKAGDFDMEATKMLNQMGHGREALQAIWKQKLKGDA